MTSQNGWSNSYLFQDFFPYHFMNHVTTRPCLLLYDGLSTHVTTDAIEVARRENVHLLSHHTSHCLQPHDVSVFSPFKKSLSSECQKLFPAYLSSCKEGLDRDNWNRVYQPYNCKYHYVWLHENWNIPQ